ncbi:MAG: hypothetical protein J7L52_06220 [Thermotogae bacterium]|nr:hypothetical protein [Thermotogota bacterium]
MHWPTPRSIETKTEKLTPVFSIGNGESRHSWYRDRPPIPNRWALERKSGKNPEECHRVSISSTGREVLYSALTTLIAFGVFILIPIPVIVQFAATVLLGLIYSLVGAVIALPIFIRLFWHSHEGSTQS